MVALFSSFSPHNFCYGWNPETRSFVECFQLIPSWSYNVWPSTKSESDFTKRIMWHFVQKSRRSKTFQTVFFKKKRDRTAAANWRGKFMNWVWLRQKKEVSFSASISIWVSNCYLRWQKYRSVVLCVVSFCRQSFSSLSRHIWPWR